MTGACTAAGTSCSAGRWRATRGSAASSTCSRRSNRASCAPASATRAGSRTWRGSSAASTARRFGGRGVTRVATVRRDGRAAYPPDADERHALNDIYKAEIPDADLVWAGTNELVEEFKQLNPRTVRQP